MPDQEEKVLVFPTSVVASKARFHGMLHQPELLNSLFATNTGRYLERSVAEKTAQFKQVIPYVLLTDGAGNYACYQRSIKEGETRLHHKYSLGIGGHINESDSRSSSIGLFGKGPLPELQDFWTGAHRELREEIGYVSERPIQLLGYVNNEATQVGQVHFGVVLRVTLRREELTDLMANKFDGFLAGQFQKLPVFLGDCRQRLPVLEDWSRIIAEALCGQFFTIPCLPEWDVTKGQ